MFTPTQEITYLGNIIDSEKMIVYLTENRQKSIIQACKHLRTKIKASIREVARVIGLIVASFFRCRICKITLQIA